MIKFKLDLYEKKTYTSVLRLDTTFDHLSDAFDAVAFVLRHSTVNNLSGSFEVEDVFPSSPSEEGGQTEEDEEVQP